VTITPLHPSLGAAIEGVDLAEPVDEPNRQTLTRALADHLALVFHGQSLTPAQYLAAASRFGRRWSSTIPSTTCRKRP
jgi:taurine dioxygenase